MVSVTTSSYFDSKIYYSIAEEKGQLRFIEKELNWAQKILRYFGIAYSDTHRSNLLKNYSCLLKQLPKCEECDEVTQRALDRCIELFETIAIFDNRENQLAELQIKPEYGHVIIVSEETIAHNKIADLKPIIRSGTFESENRRIPFNSYDFKLNDHEFRLRVQKEKIKLHIFDIDYSSAQGEHPGEPDLLTAFPRSKEKGHKPPPQ